MRSIKILGIFVILIISCSCEKESLNDEQVSVEDYILSLKAEEYDSLKLPHFSPADIPELLDYRNEDQLITNFPRNPLSSLYGPECRLGIYVMWTIEAIRLEALDTTELFMGFPSMNPIIEFRDSYVLVLQSDSIIQDKAAEAYYNWWYSNSPLSVSKRMEIDPLEETAYRWH